MSNLKYDIGNGILATDNEAYYFFHLLGCTDVLMCNNFDDHVVSAVSGKLPSGVFIRYEEVDNNWVKEYRDILIKNNRFRYSSKKDSNTKVLLDQHFNLDIKDAKINQMLFGSGVSIVMLTYRDFTCVLFISESSLDEGY